MRFDRVLPSAAVAFGAGLFGVLLFGCGSKPAEVPSVIVEGKAEDPWQRVASGLRKENDAPAARRVLSQLNASLSSTAKEYQPESLQSAEEAELRSFAKLGDDEIKELRGATYSNLDSQYLAECLFLRDVVRSLEVAKLPPVEQARVAFEWVCRQVVLAPWVLQVSQEQQIVGLAPPAAVLRRGSGSGLERAYVFLAILTQLGLDGCLIGSPDAGTKPASSPYPLADKEIPKGPFWAVGVRVGAEVQLFDPWSGGLIFGPDGQPETLAKVKANPDLVKSRSVSADDAKASIPFLSIPLSAMAPRMIRLEGTLKDTATRLYVSSKAIRERFRSEAKIESAAFWNAPDDHFNYTGVLAWFFPTEEGGFAPTGDYYGRYQASLLPLGVFAVPEQLLAGSRDDVGVPEAATRIRIISLNTYGGSFLNPPTPRERLQRGQYGEVTVWLVEKRREFLVAAERIRTDKNRDQVVKEWAEAAREVYNAFSRAREHDKKVPGTAAAANDEVEKFWNRTRGTVQAIVDLAVADAGIAESTYLLALTMHEQAIRDEARSDADPAQKTSREKHREKAADSWAEAKSWWTNYEAYAAVQAKAYPARAEHSRRLADEAKSKSSR